MEDITQTKSCTPHTQLRWTIIFLAWKSHYSDLCSSFFFIDRRMLEIAQFFYDGEKFAYFILQIQLLNFFLMML